MGSNTTNYGLIKPYENDYYNILEFNNENMDIIDNTLNSQSNKTKILEKHIYGKNLLINGNFDIWQRGDSFTKSSSASLYTADRWRLESHSGNINTKITKNTDVPNYLSKYSMKIEKGDTNNVFLRYWLPEDIRNIFNYNKNRVTLSFYVKGEVGTSIIFSLNDENATSFLLNGTWQKVSKTMNITSVGTWVEPIREIQNGDYVLLSQVKLEIGEEATPFQPTIYEEELSKCQYYFERIKFNKGGVYFASGTVHEDSSISDGSLLYAHLKTLPKRINPTFTIVNPQYLVFRPGQNKPVIITTLQDYIGDKSGNITLMLNSNNTVEKNPNGTFGFLRVDNTSVYMDIDAEI